MGYLSAKPGTGTGGSGVSSLNSLTGALNLVEGAGIDITSAGSDITISAIGANVPSDTSLAVKVATTAALPGTPTYNNGTSGVGATLTRSSNGTTGTIDGITAANLMAGDYILVKNQSAQLQNGVYSVTQQGTASLPYILTRVTEADTTAELDDLVVTAASGTTNKGVPYGQQTNNPVIGTNNIVFTATGIYMRQQTSGTQVAGQIPYYTGTALTLTKGDDSFFRDSTTKQTVFGIDFTTLTGGISNSIGVQYLGADPIIETFFGVGQMLADPDDTTRLAINVLNLGGTGASPNGVTTGVIQGGGALLSIQDFTLEGDNTGLPEYALTVQDTSGSFRKTIDIRQDRFRLRSDNGIQMFTGSGNVRIGTSSSSSSWWELPVISGPEGYVLTGHGDSASATWEPGGGSPSGNDTNVQFNDGGLFGGSDLFTWDNTISAFNAINDFQSFIGPTQFSGSGLNDMTTGGTYSGSTTLVYEITIDGFRDVITYINGTGTPFIAGNIVTGSVSGATGEVISDDGAGTLTVQITNGIHFGAGDVIDNGSGITADWDSQVSTVDTFSYTLAGVSQATAQPITGSAQTLNSGLEITFTATTGHTISNSWTVSGIQYQNTFLANRFNVGSAFGGIDSYVTGSGYADGSIGLLAFDGLLQTPTNGSIPLPTWGITKSTTGENYSVGFKLLGSGKYGFGINLNDGSSLSELTYNNDSFNLLVDEQVGIAVGGRAYLEMNSSGHYTIVGDVFNAGNGTKITIDDDSETITLDGKYNIFAGTTVTPTMEASTGGGHTMNSGYAGLYYDPASVEATATIDLPASPVDGQETTIYFGGTITTGNPVVTAITINSGSASIVGNVPSGVDSGDVLKFKYRTINTTWYRDN